MPNQWRIFAQRTYAIEKAFYAPFARVAMGLRNQFIKDLQNSDLSAAISRLQVTHQLADISPLLTKIYRTAGLMGAKLTASELKEAVKQKAGGFGRNERWIRDVVNYLQMNGLEMAQNISDTMKEDILNVLQKAIDQGWSIDRIVYELRNQNLVEARARVIARTEVIRAANVGHSIAAASTPYEVDKKWSAASDHRTRHSHRLINGHTTGELDTFKVAVYRGDKPTGQFDMMQFPGDPTAHAANVCNCRCRAIYIPKRDEAGNLIMRNPNQARVIPMNAPESIPIHQIAAALKARIVVRVEKS